MQKGEARKHHYVPRVYLKNFTFKGNQLYCLDKKCTKEKRIFPVSVEKICCQRDFYKIDGLEDPLFLEHQFSSDIESKMGKIFEDLNMKSKMVILDKFTIINEQMKRDLSSIIAIQMIRTLKERMYFFNILDKEINAIMMLFEIIQNNQNSTIYQSLVTIKKTEDIKKVIKYNTYIQLYPKILNALYDKNFVFARIVTPNIQYITSDNPAIVTYINGLMLNDTINKKVGICEQGSLVCYPISPTLILLLFPKKLVYNGFDCKCYKADLDFIKEMNKQQINYAYRQVYFNNDKDIDIV